MTGMNIRPPHRDNDALLIGLFMGLWCLITFTVMVCALWRDFT